MAKLRLRDRDLESKNKSITILKSEKTDKIRKKLIITEVILVLSIILNIYLINKQL